MEVEMHAIARGKVQGVGFRYITQRLARELNLKGTVQNLPDGSVEIYAQGPQSQITLFCQRLHDHWKGYMQPFTPTFLKQLHPYESFEVLV